MDKFIFSTILVAVGLIGLIVYLLYQEGAEMKAELEREMAACAEAGGSVYTCKVLEHSIKAQHSARRAGMAASMAAGVAIGAAAAR